MELYGGLGYAVRCIVYGPIFAMTRDLVIGPLGTLHSLRS